MKFTLFEMFLSFALGVMIALDICAILGFFKS